MLMFPDTMEPLYWPPWRFFSLFGGKAALGGLGVNPLLLTRMEDGSNPVPFPLPMKSLPSAIAMADGYCPVGMNPRMFDFAASAGFRVAFARLAFLESST